MEQRKAPWLIIALVLVIVLGGAVYAWQQGWLSAVVPAALQSVSIDEPELQPDFAQSALITPEEGGVIRTIDPHGVAFVLRVPPAAVREEIEVTITPFAPKDSGVNYGVRIEPDDLVFERTVTLGVNWYLSGKLGHKNPYAAAPFAVAIEGSKVDFVPIDKVAVTTNYVPVLVSGGGTYGISADVELARAAATRTFDTSDDRFARLYAGLSLARQDALGRKGTAALEADMAAVKAEENPPVREVYTSILLEERLSKMGWIITRAYAYGLLDGYLQFRCNLEESTYEDVLNAMITAAYAGLSEIEANCKERAEKLLLERAHEVDGDPNRPLIDAIEVLQQMQLHGIDQEPSGREVAQSLLNDIEATVEDYLVSLGQEPADEEFPGRIRDTRASDDPLLKGNSTFMQEMIGVHLLPVVGINAFDEENFKSFAERAHRDVGAFVELSRGLCDMMDGLGAGSDPNLRKECEKVRSEMMTDGLDQWKQEVEEYAEGIDDVQNKRTPNKNWDDLSPLDAFQRFLER